jgi:hypothetical protein
MVAGKSTKLQLQIAAIEASEARETVMAAPGSLVTGSVQEVLDVAQSSKSTKSITSVPSVRVVATKVVAASIEPTEDGNEMQMVQAILQCSPNAAAVVEQQLQTFEGLAATENQADVLSAVATKIVAANIEPTKDGEAVQMVQAILQGSPNAAAVVEQQLQAFKGLAVTAKALKLQEWSVVDKRGKATKSTRASKHWLTPCQHAGRIVAQLKSKVVGCLTGKKAAKRHSYRPAAPQAEAAQRAPSDDDLSIPGSGDEAERANDVDMVAATLEHDEPTQRADRGCQQSNEQQRSSNATPRNLPEGVHMSLEQAISQGQRQLPQRELTPSEQLAAAEAKAYKAAQKIKQARKKAAALERQDQAAQAELAAIRAMQPSTSGPRRPDDIRNAPRAATADQPAADPPTADPSTADPLTADPPATGGRNGGRGDRGRGYGAGRGRDKGRNGGRSRSFDKRSRSRADEDEAMQRLFARKFNRVVQDMTKKAAVNYDEYDHEQTQRAAKAAKYRKEHQGYGSCKPYDGQRKPDDKDRGPRGPPPGFEHLQAARQGTNVNYSRYASLSESQNADGDNEDAHNAAHDEVPVTYGVPRISQETDACDDHNATADEQGGGEHQEPTATETYVPNGSLKQKPPPPTGDPVYDRQMQELVIYNQRLHAIQHMQQLQRKADDIAATQSQWGYPNTPEAKHTRRKSLRASIRTTTQVLHVTGIQLNIPPWSDMPEQLRHLACGCQTEDSEDDEATKNRKSNEMNDMCQLAHSPLVTDQEYGGHGNEHIAHTEHSIRSAQTTECPAYVAGKRTHETRKSVAQALGAMMQQREALNMEARMGKGNPLKRNKITKQIQALRNTMRDLSTELLENTEWQARQGQSADSHQARPVAETNEHDNGSSEDTDVSESNTDRTAYDEAKRCMQHTAREQKQPMSNADPAKHSKSHASLKNKLRGFLRNRVSRAKFVRNLDSGVVNRATEATATATAETQNNTETPDQTESTATAQPTVTGREIHIQAQPTRTPPNVRKWLQRRWPGCLHGEVAAPIDVQANPIAEAKRRETFQEQQRQRADAETDKTWAGIKMPTRIWKGTQHKAWNWWIKKRHTRAQDTTAGPIAEARDRTNRRQLHDTSEMDLLARAEAQQQALAQANQNFMEPHRTAEEPDTLQTPLVQPMGQAAAGPLNRGTLAAHGQAPATTPGQTQLDNSNVVRNNTRLAAGETEETTLEYLRQILQSRPELVMQARASLGHTGAQAAHGTPPPQVHSNEHRAEAQPITQLTSIQVEQRNVDARTFERGGPVGTLPAPPDRQHTQTYPGPGHDWQTVIDGQQQQTPMSNWLQQRGMPHQRQTGEQSTTPNVMPQQGHNTIGTMGQQLAHGQPGTSQDYGYTPSLFRDGYTPTQWHWPPNCQLTAGQPPPQGTQPHPGTAPMGQPQMGNWQQLGIGGQQPMPHNQQSRTGFHYAKELLKGAIKKLYDPKLTEPETTGNVTITPDLREFETYIRTHQATGQMDDSTTANVLLVNCASHVQQRLQTHMGLWHNGTLGEPTPSNPTGQYTQVQWALKMLKESDPHIANTASDVRGQLHRLRASGHTFAAFTAKFFELRTKLREITGMDEYDGAKVRDYYMDRLSQQIKQCWQISNTGLMDMSPLPEAKWWTSIREVIRIMGDVAAPARQDERFNAMSADRPRVQEDITCYTCGTPGHWAKDCPNVKCYGCGKVGHYMNSCPDRPTSQQSRSRNRSPAPYRSRSVDDRRDDRRNDRRDDRRSDRRDDRRDDRSDDRRDDRRNSSRDGSRDDRRSERRDSQKDSDRSYRSQSHSPGRYNDRTDRRKNEQPWRTDNQRDRTPARDTPSKDDNRTHNAGSTPARSVVFQQTVETELPAPPTTVAATTTTTAAPITPIWMRQA